MKILGFRICAILTLILIAHACGDYWDEETTISGYKFDSNQSVSGVGIVSTHQCLSPNPILVRSGSSGSGYYNCESKILVRKDIDVRQSMEDFLSSDRTVELQENVSSAYVPTSLDLLGSFKSEPIRSMWSDFTMGGNHGGAAMNVRFDRIDTLSKEMTTKVSGSNSYQEILGSTGAFDASMKLNIGFTGTGQIGASVVGPKFDDQSILLDEFYRGSFWLAKTMKLSSKAQVTLEDDNLPTWLPCCIDGYDDMKSGYRVGYGVDSVFNCTCF